jgi:hypothetical protein
MSLKISRFVLFLDQNIIKRKIPRIVLFVIVSGLISTLLYLFLYHRYPVYFTHVNWIYQRGGDTFQHQLGWEFFRHEPWHFPIGKINSLGYPFGTNLTYLDSIPLLAIPFKILSPLIEPRFQYLGLWEFISIYLQFVIGVGILREFTKSRIAILLGAILLVLSPPMIWRAFVHSSLTAHWFILATIWICIREYHQKKPPRWLWPALFSISILVHLYFIPIILPFWAVSQYFSHRRGKKFNSILLEFIIIFITILFTGFCLGIFTFGVSDLERWGFGYYSWNLNGFINPQATSSILNGMSQGTKGQYEGYSYLGLGVLFLLVLGFSLYTQKDFKRNHLNFFLPLFISSLIYILLALSDKAYLNNKLLWNITLPQQLHSYLSIFRSSGRFIWPVFYLFFLFAIISVIRNTKFPAFFLILAITIQIVDIQPLYSARGTNQFVPYEDPLISNFWKSAGSSNRSIILYPATESAMDSYGPIAEFAQINKMNLNWGYFARSDNSAIEEYAEMQINELQQGQADPETLFIFYNDQGYQVADSLTSENIVTCYIDGYKISFSRQNGVLRDSKSWDNLCELP